MSIRRLHSCNAAGNIPKNVMNEPTPANQVADAFPMPVVPATPPPELRYRRALQLGTALRLLVRARHTVWGLMVRQLRSQYSQQVLGLAWALVAPLAQTLVFSVLLTHTGTKNTIRFEGVPPKLFLFIGLVAYSLFSGGVATGGSSLVGNPLLNKVYAPREVFPLAQVGTSVVNAIASAIVFPVLFVIAARGPSLTALWSPLPLMLLLLFTTAVALFVSAITVYARDLRSGLPLILQLGMFAPGVLYPITQVLSSPNVRAVYAGVFPMGTLIDQARQSFFLDRVPDMHLMLICGASTFVWLTLGFMFFKRLETGFADVS